MRRFARLWRLVRLRPFRAVEILAALLGLAVAFGVDLDAGQQTALLGLVGTVIGAGEVAQTKATPLADPRDETGRPLRSPNDV